MATNTSEYYKQERLEYLANRRLYGYKRLTVDVIKDKFWNPVTKVGSPVTLFFQSQYACDCGYDDVDINWEKMTPTGALILVDLDGTTVNLRIEDWLSTKPGLYSDKYIVCCLEFKEQNSYYKSNLLQIAITDKIKGNYLSMSVDHGSDCWYTEEDV